MVSLAGLLAMGATPFLLGDLVKITAAAIIAKGFIPKNKN
jgi:biotin transporter BioY